MICVFDVFVVVNLDQGAFRVKLKKPQAQPSDGGAASVPALAL